MKSLNMTIVSLLILVFCVGCSSVSGPKITNNNIQTIQKGTTTKKDVIAMFGKPLHISHKDDGSEIFMDGPYYQTAAEAEGAAAQAQQAAASAAAHQAAINASIPR